MRIKNAGKERQGNGSEQQALPTGETFENRALSCRRIFVYTFCLINICLSLSDDAYKIKTLNIERA